MEKLQVEMLQSLTEGQVVAEGGAVTVKAAPDSITEPSGEFDPTSGQLKIRLPNIGEFVIAGLPKTSDMGSGPAGLRGAQGRDGIAALTPRDGQQGPDGCMGSDGAEGLPGKDGPRGREGDPGGPGPEGERGEAGADGHFKVFIQSTDPGPVGPGAVWIRPRAKVSR